MIKFIDSISVAQKKVLLRVDFNIPLDARGRIRDDFRIRRTLPTIEYLLRERAKKIILVSHLGRPGKKDRGNPRYSLQPVAERLEMLLKKKIYFFPERIDSSLRKKIQQLPFQSIILLENLRFYPEENGNNQSFAQQLAFLADIFVNDAFAVSQRQVASLCAITTFLPSFGGLLLKEELTALDNFLENSSSLVVILGGAKIREKIPLVGKFCSSADSILLGGMIANIVLQSWRKEMRLSLEGKLISDRSVLKEVEKLRKQKAKIVLPLDFFVLNQGKRIRRSLVGIEKSDTILDIGPETSDAFRKHIASARRVLWNGPLGKFEDERFREGTKSVIEAILKNKEAKVVIGGGDTLAAVRILEPGLRIQNTPNRFFSTGGGAMLKYLAKEPLPGLQVLDNK